MGLPNAGKSTLLSRVSRARPRIAPYPFTTLEPALGIVALDEERQMVVADLPGLIEGAHLGKGLGLQFLRHVERTRALAFLVECNSEDPRADLALLEREVSLYSPSLLEKPRLTVITKSDLVPAEERQHLARARGLPDALVISAQSGEGLTPLLERWWAMIGPPVRADETTP